MVAGELLGGMAEATDRSARVGKPFPSGRKKMPVDTSITRIAQWLFGLVSKPAATTSGAAPLPRAWLGLFTLWFMLFNPTGGLCSPAAESETSQPKSWWIEPQVNWWFPTLHGRFLSSVGGAPGTNLHPGADLGMKTVRNFVWPSLTAHLADRHRLIFSYLPMNYGGDLTLTQSVSFFGRQFAAGTNLHSELSLTDYSATYQYDVLQTSKGSGFVSVQVHYLDFKARLDGNPGSQPSTAVEKKLQLPVPTIGAGLRTQPIYGLSVNGDFHIFKLGVGSFKGELIDSHIGLTLNPFVVFGTTPRELCSTFAPTLCLSTATDRVAISTGFRYFRVQASDADGATQVDWLQKGPYIALSIKF
jgi:hypothetical protein